MSTILGSTSGRARAVAVATLVLVLFAPFASTLFSPRGEIFGEMIFGDNPAYYFFAHDFVARTIRMGEMPLWNPYAMLGFPQLAEGQAGIFHPLSTLYYVFPTEIAMNWVISLAIVFAGVAFWGYLRALSIGPAAAWCGAIVWAMGGRMPARIDAGHLNMLVGFLSWPLVLGAWERYRTTGRFYHLGVLALSYAALIFAGYPQYTFIFSLFFLCYVALQFIAANSKQQAAADLKAVCWLALFVLLGIGIAAAQLLPTLDFMSRSSRANSAYEFSSSLSLPPESLLTVLTPNFFGYSATGTNQYWGRSLNWETCLYVGILPVVAAVVGAFAAPREKRTALVGCALLFLAVGFGRHTPIYGLIYEYVPLAGLFRAPSRYSAVAFFCLATLTGYGMQAIFQGFSRRQEREISPATAVVPQVAWLRAASFALLGLAVLVCGLLAYFLLDFSSAGSRWHSFMRWVDAQRELPIKSIDVMNSEFVGQAGRRAMLGLTQALLLLAATALLLYAAWRPAWRRLTLPLAVVILLGDLGLSFSNRLSTFDAAMTRLPEPFADVIDRHQVPPRVHDLTAEVALGRQDEVCQTFHNQGMSYGFTSLSGYTDNVLERYASIVGPEGRAGAIAEAEWMRRLYRMLSVEYVMALESDLEPGTPIVGRHLGRVLVPLHPPFARARLLREALATDDPQEAEAYIRNQNTRPSSRPILETTEPLPTASPLRPAEVARITEYTNTRVELDVFAAQPRVLLLAEMYDKNWRATVDGKPAAVMPANYLLRAVRVPMGRSQVVFEYVDPLFRWGTILSLASLLITLAIVVGSYLSARRDLSVDRPAVSASGRGRAAGSAKSCESELAMVTASETSAWRCWGFRSRR
ncbi:MAG: YfhO family protein [Pirellulales bacterium]|nr:YfhO family protein [Pirellulales bacterium]